MMKQNCSSQLLYEGNMVILEKKRKKKIAFFFVDTVQVCLPCSTVSKEGTVVILETLKY